MGKLYATVPLIIFNTNATVRLGWFGWNESYLAIDYTNYFRFFENHPDNCHLEAIS